MSFMHLLLDRQKPETTSEQHQAGITALLALLREDS
jgi:hypothetical protein